MPTTTKRRMDKASQACLETAAILSSHPEFDQFNKEEDLSTFTHYGGHTVVCADIRFLKDGTEIFKNPLHEDDHDWPDLVGRHILESAAKRAAKTAGLRLNPTTKIYIAPSEKGWVRVGYQFVNQNAVNQSPE